MGCDIHLYVEKKVGENWTALDKFEREEPDEDYEAGYISVPYSDRLYSGRNYDLFAILADVRNGSGFAGCKTGDGFVPIAMPRGIPDDASAEVKEIAEQWDVDGHSHSFFTLRELLDYDWTQTTKKTGWVDFAEWERWSRYARHHGEGPQSYCGGGGGANIEHVSAEEMDARVSKYRELQRADNDAAKEFASSQASVYAQAVWETSYFRAADDFFACTLPRLLKLAGGTAGLDDLRIVFFFDN